MSAASAAALQAIADLELPAGVDRVKLSAWLVAQDELLAAKERELDIRKDLLAAAFPGMSAGTRNLDLGRGYALKAEQRENYKLDAPKTRVALDRLCKLGPAGVLIADRLVKWEAELRVGEYKRLDAKQRAFFKAALTVRDGQASLKFVEPKAPA